MALAQKAKRTIVIANQKGGVGKTTTVMNLGRALVKEGKKVLLIDADPQANLTSYLGVTPGAAPFENIRTLDEVFLAKKPLLVTEAESFITRTNSGMDLIGSDAHLTGVDAYLYSRADKEKVLSGFLTMLKNRYDYIFIDTPPTQNLLTLNAIVAADSVIIPIQPEFFSLEGIVKIRTQIESIKNSFQPKLEILGILATQVNERRKLTGDVMNALKAEFGAIIFNSMIHESAAVAESSGHAKSVLDYDKSSRASKDFRELAQELLTRTGEAHL
jgi:chromosome partitioning protein